jgi:hypothetical protein
MVLRVRFHISFLIAPTNRPKDGLFYFMAYDNWKTSIALKVQGAISSAESSSSNGGADCTIPNAIQEASSLQEATNKVF